MPKIVMKGWQSHLEFLTSKRANPVAFSRNGGKNPEMRLASHPLSEALLLGIVNAITFIFAFLPAPNFACP
ncbi:hypothetical protein [Pseudescherichia vulneris]|uniref:hypothetical protein n=1 Tax=Pseudescherichia vulneris TaxID=566 RepID=UPI0028D1AE69|nr:hypothetical protein [Pseudescherichia vulneris]